MMKSMTKRVVLGVPTVALSAALVCTLGGCGGGANDEAKNEAKTIPLPPLKRREMLQKPSPRRPLRPLLKRKRQLIASRSAQRPPMGGSS